MELNLKGPPYPKRAHSRRCIHLVGRKGDQKLNSYLEVFATSLSLRCMRVCVCARVCSCTFYLSVRFHVEFCSLDRYVRACSNTAREYTRIWRSVVSCRSWFISFDVVFFSPRRWSKLLFDLYIRNWNYIFWLIFIREYSRIARRNRYLEGGGWKISTLSNVLDILKGTMLSQTLPIRTINSDKSSGNNTVSIQPFAIVYNILLAYPCNPYIFRPSFIYIYAFGKRDDLIVWKILKKLASEILYK